MDKNRLIQSLSHFRVYVVAGVFFLLANIIFYMFVVVNQKSDIERLQNQYIGVRSSLKEKKVTEKELQLIRADTDLKSFESSLPDVEELVERVREIYTLINKNELEVDKVIFKPEKDERVPFQKYVTSFSVTGKYQSIKMLLSEIQNLPALFCIEDIQFINKSKEAENVGMKLSISTYFRAPKNN